MMRSFKTAIYFPEYLQLTWLDLNLKKEKRKVNFNLIQIETKMYPTNVMSNFNNILHEQRQILSKISNHHSNSNFPELFLKL